MGKVKILKTSYLKRKIREIIVKIFLLDYKFLKNKKENKNILIITMDALGDNIVKSRTIEILAEEYGKENIYILCKNKWKILYEMQGYKNIFVDETKWNVFYKIKLYRKLNKIGFFKVAIFNHSSLPPEERYIYSGEKYDMSESVNYILEKHIILLNKILKRKFILVDVKPDIRKYFPDKKYKNIISIALGASNDKRTLPIYKMEKIILQLLNKFPDKTIMLLGAGKKQNNYCNTLMNDLKNNERIKETIDKIPLLETIQIIKDSDLFIGYDSGLLNIAFTLKKKSICLHWSEKKYVWEHDCEFVKTLKGNGTEKDKNEKYGTPTLNSITFEQIENAIDELEIFNLGENNI